MEIVEKCKTCKFWQDYRSRYGMGGCHKNSPRPILKALIISDCKGDELETTWPETWEGDWCGDWEHE